MKSIASFAFEGEGMKRVYENPKWMVGLKNYKPANDVSIFDEIERHRETDELFVLLAGSCVLLSATEEGSQLRFEAVNMEAGRLYSIPALLWHTTLTKPGTKLVLVEDSSTGAANSDVRKLGVAELGAARKAVEEA